MRGLHLPCVLSSFFFLHAHGLRSTKDGTRRSFLEHEHAHPLSQVAGPLEIEGGDTSSDVPSLQNSNTGAGDQHETRGDFASLREEMQDLPFETDLPDVAYPAAHGVSNVTFSSIRASKKEKPFLWVHIHKAAGTFMCMMARQAGERVVKPQSNCNWAGHDRYKDIGHPERAVGCAQRKSIFLQNGFTWGQIERELWPADHCWNDFDYGIMLRQPMELVHSFLNYNLKYFSGNGRGSMRALERRLKIHPRLRRKLHIAAPQHFPEWLFLDNIVTRLLTNNLELPAGGLKPQHVVQAKDILKHFKVVAILEELPSASVSIFKSLGWPAHLASHVREKKLENPKDSMRFTPAEKRYLRWVNRWDIKLYNSYAGKTNTSSSLKSFANPRHR